MRGIAPTTTHGKPCRKCGGTERYVSTGKCKPCQRARVKRSADKNRDKYKERYRGKYPQSAAKRTLGISPAEFQQMAEDRGWRCAICKKVKPLVVDHCHTHGHFRDLLCSPCNRGLGFFRDSPEALRAAAEYLERPR
jgi:hypothetical protein